MSTSEGSSDTPPSFVKDIVEGIAKDKQIPLDEAVKQAAEQWADDPEMLGFLKKHYSDENDGK